MWILADPQLRVLRVSRAGNETSQPHLIRLISLALYHREDPRFKQ